MMLLSCNANNYIDTIEYNHKEYLISHFEGLCLFTAMALILVYTSQITYHLHQTALTMMSDFVMEHYQIEAPYRYVSMEHGATSAQEELDIKLQRCCVVNLDIKGEVDARHEIPSVSHSLRMS